ncbi:IS256-like element IS1553 family transposase [Streptomyces thioluteus]|uniref:Mutator family transposase n=1 Tax=Streptomyces thioluteus TaxID=66431 RepID=A0ABN3WWF1_STRTU
MESLRTADGIELVRVPARRILQEPIEAEATAHIGAEPGEHAETRTTWRNGHREKALTTQAGDLDLAIPKVRTVSFLPSLLERRRRIGQALYAVIMEAYVHGASTRSVDDLVEALGGDTGISRSEVSRICQDLDAELTVFRTRPLDHTRFPCIYLDATYCKARVQHQLVSQALVIATGITEDGGREALGLMVDDSETEVFWPQFPRSLRGAGPDRVRPVIADHHSGLVKAVRKVMLGAGYQRCRVPFLRNTFAVIPKDSGELAAATIRTIFAQPTAELVRARPGYRRRHARPAVPKVRGMLLEAKEDLTAFADFPEGTGRRSSRPTAGTTQPRDQTPHRRRPVLPQPRRPRTAHHRRPRRDARRMDRLPPAGGPMTRIRAGHRPSQLP